MHDVLTLGDDELSGLQVLSAVGTDASRDALLGYVLLIVLHAEPLRLDEGHEHLHHQEEEGEGEQCYEQCHEELRGGVAGALGLYGPRCLHAADAVVALSGSGALPLSGVVHHTGVGLVLRGTVGVGKVVHGVLHHLLKVVEHAVQVVGGLVRALAVAEHVAVGIARCRHAFQRQLHVLVDTLSGVVQGVDLRHHVRGVGLIVCHLYEGDDLVGRAQVTLGEDEEQVLVLVGGSSRGNDVVARVGARRSSGCAS